MSAVIKSGAAVVDLKIRDIAVAPTPAAPSAEARMIAELESRLERAESALASRVQEVERLTASLATVRNEGRELGLVEGRRLAEDRSGELVRAFAEAAASSAALLDKRLGALEALVGDLAAVALERIVGDAPGRPALVIDTVRRAVGDLFAGSVVAIEVSAADFADAAPLHAVLPQACEVHILDGLPSGGCRLRLRMGEVDLDLGSQAARLRAILDPSGGAA